MTDDPLDAAFAGLRFTIPEERIARHPPPERDGGRLLVLGEPPRVPHRHATIHDLPDLLRPGDLLVVNDVRVHRARLRAHRRTGGAVEVMLVAPSTALEEDVDDATWEALVRPARRLNEGERLRCGPGVVEIQRRRPDGSFRVRCLPDVDTLTSTAGELPLPPYLDRAPQVDDEARYQTVYARPRPAAGSPGWRAAAAPTAGLHFTPALLATLAARGVRQARVTLEVGAGTFRPLDVAAVARGELHPERYVLPAETWAALEETRAAGGRVVAVGTTATRVLESATGPGEGVTRLFLRPGATFRRVDVLFTNFHLPQSSLLLLVAAFAGVDRVRSGYEAAMDARYRFYSYGDAMWAERAR